MFSFHKPKVYRSTTGCCICKAKSSSSRFTDSKKYEIDFLECFQLSTPRQGEICNACVLLVKRFKRLPPGSDRHWGHVVDARVGPGLKSMTKFKKRKEEQNNQGDIIKSSISKATTSSVPEKFCKIFKKAKKIKLSEKRNSASSGDESTSGSPIPNYADLESIESKFAHGLSSFAGYLKSKGKIKNKRKSSIPIKNRQIIKASYIDDNIWLKQSTCCGIVFKSRLHNGLIIDIEQYNQCKEHKLLSLLNEKKLDEMKCFSNYNTSFIMANKITDFTMIPTNLQSNENLSINKSNATTALKKHQLYSKRQMILDINGQNVINKTEQKNDDIIKKPDNYLHKLSGDSLNINKSNLLPIVDKLVESKIKNDANVVKNLVKLCTEKTSKLKILSNGVIIVENQGNGKMFSDNSSDSGYDEISMQDNAQKKLFSTPSIPKAPNNTVKCVIPTDDANKALTMDGNEILQKPIVNPQQIKKAIDQKGQLYQHTANILLIKPAFGTQKHQTAN